jgi:uncharacterized membrane protein
MDAPAESGNTEFTAAELGAIAHLYRGEIYRSTIWRSRLDQTTNWAVVTTGLALSISYSSTEASALPLILVGLLVVVFLMFEARRYRYFNVWRARCRLMETDIYAPMLRGRGVHIDGRWNTLLSNDYLRPRFHISFVRAIGRRLRKNYSWILLIQAVAYYGKLVIHPTALDSADALFRRAAIGPIPGETVVAAGLLFHGGWITFALVMLQIEKRHRQADSLISIA